MNSKIKLWIIRGLPGSGKSTYAKKLVAEQNIAHFENDMFFMNGDKYEFNQAKAKDAADWCYNSVAKELKAGRSCVVSNVFVSKKSIDRYVDLAKSVNAEYVVCRMTTQFKNIHDVPTEVFDSMKRFMCKYPDEELIK